MRNFLIEKLASLDMKGQDKAALAFAEAENFWQTIMISIYSGTCCFAKHMHRDSVTVQNVLKVFNHTALRLQHNVHDLRSQLISTLTQNFLSESAN